MSVFADAAGEGESVEAVHGGCIGSAVFGCLVAENVDCQRGFLIAFEAGLVDVAHVRTEAGNGEEAGLMVEKFVYFFGWDF